MIREFYRDQTIFLTGVTGFLGKGLAAKILRDLPDIRRLYVLIRPRKKANGQVSTVAERLEEDFFDNSVFDQLKKSDPQALARLRQKVEAVDGDLTASKLGLDPQIRQRLVEDVDLIINSAATVDFDGQLDYSVQLNTLGPQRLLDFARECQRKVIFLHISTAYVNGRLEGSIPERPLPLDRTIRQLLDGGTPARPFEPEREVDECLAFCRRIRQRATEAGQLALFRREILEQKTSRVPSGKRLDKLVEDRCRRWIESELVGEGMRRAKAHAWNDVYTFTKAMGEQLLVKEHGSVPLVIVRPSVIESSLVDPEPGWISGFKVTDPLVVAFGRGLVPDFPGRADVPMDLVPVDIVINVVLGAATQATAAEVRVFQAATSGENPMLNATMFRYIKEHFLEHPMLGKDGRAPELPDWSFPSLNKFRAVFHLKYLYPVEYRQRLFKYLPERWAPAKKKRMLSAIRTRLKRVLYYTELFSPYTLLDCRFEFKRSRALFESLPPEEQQVFNMDVQRVDWGHYYKDVHLPGLRRHVLKEESAGDASLMQGTAS
ncbi:MAG: NAD-dependent epimerase/dehydratase family protein [Candidatus Latescibacteria bacterium]|nr:NAD-dependent epimerase/dehydratase family protein [Candidatus Latescibacterota bacterium]